MRCKPSHRASALNLVAGAIVLWNTTYLQAARMHLANLGRPVPPDLLQHLSPLGWQHINLTGDYLWTDPDAPSTALRPLLARCAPSKARQNLSVYLGPFCTDPDVAGG
jgi:hypothetical protein